MSKSPQRPSSPLRPALLALCGLACAAPPEEGQGKEKAPQPGAPPSRTRISDAPIWSRTGASPSEGYGTALHGGSDLNGDGAADLVVGAPGGDSGYGEVSVHYGGALWGGSSDEVLTATGITRGLGFSLAGPGDVNGDGLDDLLIGAPETSSSRGLVALVAGSPTALSAVAVMVGEEEAHLAGYAMAGLGDVNGDGALDYAMGLPGAGQVWVYFGSDRPSPQPDQILMSPEVEALYGAALAGGEDLNLDGYADLAVGGPSAGGGAGGVWVYLGGPSGLSGPTQSLSGSADAELGSALAMSPDLDLDGRAELLVGAPGEAEGDGELHVYSGSADGLLTVPLVVSSPSEGGAFGASLAFLGDLEGDGRLDLAVGAPEDSDGDGAVYTLTAEGGALSEAERLAGGSAGQSYGSVLSPGGDLDGDGLGELVVGTGHRAGLVEVLEAVIDEDEDGYDAESDCNDADPDIHPGATERVGDGVDQNCDGEELCFEDDDDDGYLDRTGDTRISSDEDCSDRFEGSLASPLTDCDDNDPALHPGAPEGPGDGVDSDCDGQELCFADADGDGVVAEGVLVVSADLDCVDAGEGSASLPGGDCDDSNPDIRPDTVEQAGDGVDSDCDGLELCYADGDGDGHRPGPSATVDSDDVDCTDPGEASAEAGTGDCDDSDAEVHPGALEGTGDEVDQDCDGMELCFADRDNDGYLGASGGAVLSADTDCQDAGEGSLSTPTTDCDDHDSASHPGATEKIGDGVDQDCDGAELCYVDADQDGYRGATGATVASSDPDCLDPGEAEARQPAVDCDDFNDDVNPEAEEQVADQVDSNCDGVELCYADADRDGFRDAEGATVESDDPDCLDGGEADAQDPTGDCDDSDALVYPGASEVVADGIDQDCDGEDPASQFDLVGQGKTWVGGGVACSAVGPGGTGALLGLLGLLAGASRRREVRP